MPTVSAADLLSYCERGARLHTIDRALGLLALAMPDRDPAELARLPLGVRDGLLLRTRRAIVGPRIEAQDSCRACGARVEAALDCDAITAASTPPAPSWSLDLDGYRIRLRPLDSRDAAEAAQAADVERARFVLLQRAVTSVERDGIVPPLESIPAHLVEQIVESLPSHDTGAELAIEFRCPSCERRWTAVLDVASFVWRELVARAQRLLLDVHTLATAYGWTESEILALGSSRRAAYVSLVTR